MIGTATEPTVEQTVEIVAACKQQTIVNIKIRNWLGSRQTFNATYTILQPTGGHGLQVQVSKLSEVISNNNPIHISLELFWNAMGGRTNITMFITLGSLAHLACAPDD